MKKLLFILFIILLNSCTNNDKKTKEVSTKKQKAYLQKIKFVKSGIKKFELDSLTAPLLAGIQLYDANNNYFLAYLNEETGSMYFNDMQTFKIVKTISMKGSSQEFKKKFQGFYVHTPDSIFMVHFSPHVSLVNDSGIVLKKYNVKSLGNKRERLLTGGLSSTTKNHPYLFQNKLYISSYVVGNLEDKEQRQVQIILNLNNGQTYLGSPVIPKEYNNKDFGGIHYFLYSTTFNPSTKSMIYSFPASSNLYINPLGSTIMTSKIATSTYFDTIDEYEESKYSEAKSMKVGEYFMQNPSYGTVLYDKYRDVYYRMALLPVDVKNANYEAKNPPLKKISLIVFDKNFNYLGETQLERDKYWSASAFVSRDGLNIQNRTDSDATLDFTTFKFVAN